jgi:hypothetical protein
VIFHFYTRFQKPRFSIAELMAVVASLATALAWPVLLFPTCVAVLSLALLRMGFTLIAVCIMVSILGFALGFLAASGYLRWYGDVFARG